MSWIISHAISAVKSETPQVAWMMRLDAAGIWPRFEGVHRLTTNERKEHIVNVTVPGLHDDDLSVIADRLISGE